MVGTGARFYVVAIGHNWTELEVKVNKLIEDGYSPYGSLVVDSEDIYVQPMLANEKSKLTIKNIENITKITDLAKISGTVQVEGCECNCGGGD